MIRALWLATGVALTAHLAGAPHALAAAAVLAGAPALRLLRHGPLLGLEVRAIFLAVLALGTLFPFLHAMQLAGAAVLVVFDYCILARTLSLLPWHRRGPLTLPRLRATFLIRPVRGDLLGAIDRRSVG